MSKFIVSLLSLCFLLSSCENMTEKELEDTISSGVVLVQNQSYYEVVLSNGESIFFLHLTQKETWTGSPWTKIL